MFRSEVLSTMSKNYFIRFPLKLTADQYLRVYQGSAKRISVLAENSQRIEFPAQNIRQFLAHDGIKGLFEMELTCNNKFVAIKKISQ